jgi:hypothetical protein
VAAPTASAASLVSSAALSPDGPQADSGTAAIMTANAAWWKFFIAIGPYRMDSSKAKL